MTLWLAALMAVSVAAETPPPSAAVDSDPAAREIAGKIPTDPALAASIARRVARSRLIGSIASPQEQDPQGAAERWVRGDPESAARIALGLAADDRAGKPNFEDGLVRAMGTGFEWNPGAEKNTYSRLRQASSDMDRMQRRRKLLTEEERDELMRSIFEGEGSSSGRVLTMNGGAGNAAGAATAVGSGYDRLSGVNLRGFSPQLVALQNEMNRSRPPGAPPLPENGRLDYATLAFPAFGFDFDAAGLARRLSEDRTKFGGAGSELREELVRQAQAAAAAFRVAAEPAKSPANISSALLAELVARRGDAARWITAAAIAEEDDRERRLEGFLTADLLAQIDAAPEPENVRAAYKAAGRRLEEILRARRAVAAKAIELLKSDSWRASLAEIDRLRRARGGSSVFLERRIAVYRATPGELIRSGRPRPRWEVYAEAAARRLAPSSTYARRSAARRRARTDAKTAFESIAAVPLR